MFEPVADQKSADSTIDYMQAVKRRIFADMRAGMAEATGMSAENAEEATRAAGIRGRTDRLFDSPIMGVIRARIGRAAGE